MAANPTTWGAIAEFPARFRRRMSGGDYRPEIDGLQFLAIAIVVVGHVAERAVRFFPSARETAHDSILADLFQRAGLGVYLFFTISGFIIATQARKSAHSSLSPAFLKSYYWRRMLRIEPPYILLLICTWLALTVSGYAPEGANHFNAEPQSLNLSLFGSMVYMHGLIWGAYPRLFPPGWSLEVEVQFYILAPLVFWLWFQLRQQALRIGLAGVVLAAAAIVSLKMGEKIGPAFVDKSILRFLAFFWLGILLADARPWIVRNTAWMSGPAASAIGWGGLILYLVIPNAPDSLALGLLTRAAVYATLTAMFVSAWAPGGGFTWFCTRPWISLIGGACYSIYLVHMQTTQVLSTLASKLAPNMPALAIVPLMLVEYAAIVAIGLLFYVLVERTFMLPDWHVLMTRWIGRRTHRTPASAAE